MSLQLVANHLAQKGRGPDSTLVHMSNREVAGLQALAKRHGGELSVNPDTGLPEAGFLDSILPTIAGAGLTYFSGGAISPLMAAGIVGGISALDSKDLSKGLMAGLGAYGGAGLTQGFMGAGLGAVGPELTAQAATDATAQGLQGEAYNQAVQNQVASGLAEKNLAAEGVSQLFSNPGQTLETIGGGSGYKAAGMLGAAAAPMIADEMVETTTEAPPQDRGKIRPYTYSRQQAYPTQDYQDQQGNMGSKERRYFNESYTAGDPYSAANGGLVALATGGYTNQNIFRPTTPLPENNMYGASRDAYDYLMGVNPTSGGGQTRPYDPINDIRIDDGKNLNPNTPKTGTGKYVFDPVTRQYKWIPDPVAPVDAALPVFENPAERGGGGGDGYANSPEGRAEREARMDKLRAELGEEGYAKRNDWIGETLGVVGKVLNPLGFLDMFKGVPLSETTPEEDKAVQDLEARTIRDLNGNVVAYKSPPDQFAGYQPNSPVPDGVPTPKITTAPEGTVGSTPPQGNPAQQAAIRDAINNTDFSGMDRGSISAAPRTPDTQAVQNAINNTDFSGMDRNGGGGGGYGGGGDGAAGRGEPGGDRGGWGRGGGYAHGGIANLHQYNLGSYSDGGRLLKGPGDGVSDSIPATIGRGQPARLADGEFVIPARIVSELGNGSTDAGARALYKMMDRIQAGRRKTVGKDQVAKNSKSARHLPA